MADYEQNKRLKKIIEEGYKISPIEFSKKYSDPKAVKTYNIISERNGISNKMLVDILEAYPEINKVWLLTGEGEMFKRSSFDNNTISGTVGIISGNNNRVKDVIISSSSVGNKEKKNTKSTKPSERSREVNSIKSIPLIPIDAMAGNGSGEMQILEYECERFIIPTFRDAEFLISVRGSSMRPKYNSGDIVACKKLPLNTFFQWNKVYVLDTTQGVLIKRVSESKKPEHILIVSDNTDYPPFDLHISEIHSLAIVIGVIRLE